MNRERMLNEIKRSLWFLPDLPYVKLYFRMRLKRKLDIQNPVYFNDKLQWMKFNYRVPLQTVVSDKYLVRKYASDKIGQKYLIPVYSIVKQFSEIDFDALPNQFVLKCNHDSGGLAICTDKTTFDITEAEKKISRSLKRNFFYVGREYQYKQIAPRILCEKFLSDGGRVPMDYKIYCFNGVPDVILVCKDRFDKNSHRAKYYFFDHQWNFLRMNKGDEAIDPPEIEKPERLGEMLEIAKALSADFPFARIDLYYVEGEIYFGEITLTPNSGFDPDITLETDRYFGDKLHIPCWEELMS